jgi:hypothetical protein
MRFAFAYDKLSGPLFAALGMGPSRSWIEVEGGALRVRMGWAFKLETATGSIDYAETLDEPIPALLGVGVHGWHRVWSVNPARRPHVKIRFAAPQHAWTLKLPVWIEILHLAPADPEGLAAALRQQAPA